MKGLCKCPPVIAGEKSTAKTSVSAIFIFGPWKCVFLISYSGRNNFYFYASHMPKSKWANKLVQHFACGKG